MTAAFPASTASEFHGLTIPEGVEKRILYHSSFRAIATYAMSLADLDREIQHMVHTRRGVIKEDARRNLGGKRACLFYFRSLVACAHATAAALCTQLMWSPRTTRLCTCSQTHAATQRLFS